MIFQKDIQVYRFDNIHPTYAAPEKYEYQLFKGDKIAISQFSDHVYRFAVVTVSDKIKMMLVNTTQDIDLEDENTFIIDVKTI